MKEKLNNGLLGWTLNPPSGYHIEKCAACGTLLTDEQVKNQDCPTCYENTHDPDDLDIEE